MKKLKKKSSPAFKHSKCWVSFKPMQPNRLLHIENKFAVPQNAHVYTVLHSVHNHQERETDRDREHKEQNEDQKKAVWSYFHRSLTESKNFMFNLFLMILKTKMFFFNRIFSRYQESNKADLERERVKKREHCAVWRKTIYLFQCDYRKYEISQERKTKSDKISWNSIFKYFFRFSYQCTLLVCAIFSNDSKHFLGIKIYF